LSLGEARRAADADAVPESPLERLAFVLDFTQPGAVAAACG
jgi:hypothetical protein